MSGDELDCDPAVSRFSSIAFSRCKRRAGLAAAAVKGLGWACLLLLIVRVHWLRASMVTVFGRY
jgi:hypothetical protein